MIIILLGQEPVHSFCHEKKSWRECCIRSCKTRGSSGKRLFSFPQNPDDKNTWLLACNMELNISHQLFICERHFQQKYLGTKKLLYEAVPEINLDDFPSHVNNNTAIDDVDSPDQFPLHMQGQSGNTDISFQDFERFSLLEEQNKEIHQQNDFEAEMCTCYCKHEYAIKEKKYLTMLRKQKEENDELKKRIDLLEKELSSIRESAIIPDKSASAEALTFAKMVTSKSSKHYSCEEKDMSQYFLYESSKLYNSMKNDFNFHLPSLSTLLRSRLVKFVKPGINENYLLVFKSLIEKMTEEQKKCVLLIDEVAIKPDLEYNKSMDTINGFTDFGNGKRTKEIAKKATFIMIKSLFGKWKFIISYYLSGTGLSASHQKEIVLQNIKKVKEILDLQVVAVICDQGQNNVGMFHKLRDENEVSFHFMNEEIFLMYDYCHLQKSIRNTLLKYKLKTPDGIVDFDHIRKMFDVDQANQYFKVCPKLTLSHIEPNNFEKMKVSRAAQVLSNSVAAGLTMMMKMGFLSEDATATRDFVKKVNDLFDLLDCKVLSNENPLKRPLGRNDPQKRAKLEQMLEYMSKVEVISSKDTVKCIKGYCLTIKSMLKLSDKVFDTMPAINFILLGKFNQDALENFFFKIRSSLGASTHPSANELHYIVARLTSTGIMRHKYSNKFGNCEIDEEMMLSLGDITDKDLANAIQNDVHEGTITGDITDDSSHITIEDLNVDVPDHYFNNDNTEVQVQRYFAGYAIYRKIIRKLKCDKCISLTKNAGIGPSDKSAMLISIKNYTNNDNDLRLVNPDDKIFEICKQQMIWYKSAFSNFSQIDGIQKQVFQAIFEKTNQVFENWYDPENDCFEHRKTILQFMITVLLFKNAKWLAATSKNTLKRQITSDKCTFTKKSKKLNIQ